MKTEEALTKELVEIDERVKKNQDEITAMYQTQSQLSHERQIWTRKVIEEINAKRPSLKGLVSALAVRNGKLTAGGYFDHRTYKEIPLADLDNEEGHFQQIARKQIESQIKAHIKAAHDAEKRLMELDKGTIP